MFQAQLVDDTPIQVFIDNGATPFILPISTYNKHPVLQRYTYTYILEVVQLSPTFG